MVIYLLILQYHYVYMCCKTRIERAKLRQVICWGEVTWGKINDCNLCLLDGLLSFSHISFLANKTKNKSYDPFCFCWSSSSSDIRVSSMNYNWTRMCITLMSIRCGLKWTLECKSRAAGNREEIFLCIHTWGGNYKIHYFRRMSAI